MAWEWCGEPSTAEKMRRWYYSHLYMRLWRTWDFVYPVCIPLSVDAMSIDLFNPPRAVCFWAWVVRGIRRGKLMYYRRKLRKAHK